MQLSRTFLILLAIAVVLIPPADLRAADSNSSDLADKSIEELMNVDVTTVARKEQKLSKIPAAVYVLTHDAIQNSGATNIPDLLRTVPGVQVAQIDADRWAISIRGFNATYSNKLLVLIDGRTIYTPSFSGVFWDQIDIPLDTIERIEVVRGSGGAMWGANAVNGVINIITMHSRGTEGGKIQAGSGSQRAADFEARFGGKLGADGSYRVFGRYQDSNGLPSLYDGLRRDGWNMENLGFRLDERLSPKDELFIDGGAYSTQGGQVMAFAAEPGVANIPAQLNDNGAHVTAKWTRTHSDGAESSLQVYDSGYHRVDSGIVQDSNTVDIDFQNRFQIGDRHDIVWGTGYRFTNDKMWMYDAAPQSLATNGIYVSLRHPAMGYSLFSGFIQDEWTLTNSLALTIGSRLEHNAFSGLEVEPTARLAWTPNNENTLWVAVSRAVRQPSRLETGVNVLLPDFMLAPGIALRTGASAQPGIPAEAAMTYEAGYRIMPSTRVSVDLASFYADYSHLVVEQIDNPSIQSSSNGEVIAVPYTFTDSGSARNFGAEAALSWDVCSRWKLSGSYSWLRASARTGINDSAVTSLFGLLPSSVTGALAQQTITGPTFSPLSGSAPENSFSAQSNVRPTSRLLFNQTATYVGRLAGMGVPAYTRLDAHVEYNLGHGVQASLVGQNLLTPRHLEFFEPSQLVSSLAERSVFGRLTWSF